MEEDAKSLHFSYDDALVIHLGITNKLVKIILVDNESSIDMVFKSTLKSMGLDLDNIQKVGIVNPVGFRGEPAKSLGK